MEATTTHLPTKAPEGFVPFSEATVTEAELASCGFPVTLVGKVCGTKVVMVEGVGDFFAARGLAMRAGFVRWATTAEFEAAFEARVSASRCEVDLEVLAFLAPEVAASLAAVVA